MAEATDSTQQTSGSSSLANGTSDGPTGGNYEVRQGDCLSSIAFEHGFFWETLWNHANNADLKQKRKDPNVLFPGDEVYIPDKKEKEVACASEQRHRFKRKGVPEILRIRFLDAEGQPRDGLPYVLDIDGMVLKGTTKDDGTIEEHIPPDARKAVITLGTGDEEEVREFNLGHLDPVTEITGVQGRLNNLGYHCGDEYGVLGEKTRRAISEFQADHGLKATGELDDQTRKTLDKEHQV
jgi:hypothetical protein